jgi:lipoprotein-releasing system ATP-binding protein
VLAVDNLYKSFQSRAGERVEVLRGVTFELAAGEMVALVGASGAGKSTLLQIIGGLDVGEAGDVRLEGKSVAQQDSRSTALFRNQEIGFVFQFHHLLPDLSAEENVALPLLVRRTPARRALDAAREMLDAVGLDARRRHTPASTFGRRTPARRHRTRARRSSAPPPRR